MKPLMLVALVACVAGPLLPQAASAAGVNRACLQSDRKAVSRQLCSCIDRVARGTLNGSEQRLAATLILEPLRSQDIRFSDRRSHERFWENYKQFSTTAQRICG